jgi:large subunit ribosomal protein L23
MKPASQVIARPVLTEKATDLVPGADRRQVKAAVEAAFKVTVTKVNILVRKGKVRRSRLSGGSVYRETDTRRAIVTLKKGDTISFA